MAHTRCVNLRSSSLWRGLALVSLLVGLREAHAQKPRPPTLTHRGHGAPTVVLVSGIVGGVAGYKRLEAALLESGCRVITIDPYGFSLDSADVTFDALARRVDALLASLAVDSAVVVGHAHGAGVALRLAANHPDRVESLVFLDVGALSANRTKVFSGALRFVPLITKLPGGRGYVRSRFVKGLRKNSGRAEWLDSATIAAYAEPMLDHIGPVSRMTGRLARAIEPESVSVVLGRVRVPVMAILGTAPRPAAPDSGEVERLHDVEGSRLRVTRLEGVGHFPHEEAPKDVAALVLARR